MGVPKFFRYTSERYPCLNELVKQYQIPEFDNMYLDMNGIIHNCSHPDDSNPHFRITEEKIFQDIFHYISILFQIIKPKKLFFMAIDGVAPRAKMNQQRGRRFRSAREAEKLEDDAKKKGEVLPAEKRFDSNCITPGTVFMARLHDQLRYFVKQKISSDPLWAQVKVILSGHETPGEGEHKIMDYIRWARSQADYDPNTRHCLYGLDADLIMLGMCTHEPHFALLREEVKFGKTTQRTTSPEETNFYLLHLSLLREYLEQEFITIKDKLPFAYDIEKIVDDWVLMGFLVGNDFIPNLPNMHISNDALPLLYKTYMTVLPTLDGYINEAGDLNLARFETFMQELAKIDKEKFQDTYADLKYFEAKTGRRPNANERKEYKPNNDETFNVDIDDIKSNKPDDDLQALINATQEMFMDDMEADEEYEETSDEEANIEMEFILHKKDYYMNKLDYTKVTEEVLADQAEGYVRAIQWNLFYYYKGCPSWCWYYPHHYAPYISDIKGFKDLKIEFELGEPFKPFEQLLAVLPSASKHLLPAPFHDLMTDEDSPIVHYYPVHFETDLNGKRNDWEAVVLIPFIDEANLLSAMAPCYQRLTEDELKRNRHGPMLMFTWVPDNLGEEHAPEYFPSIKECHTYEKQVWRQEIAVPKDLLKRGMLPNANRDLLFPGFPTMRHLKYKTSLKKSKVKVFDQPSRNDNMIVEIIKDNLEEEPLEKIAHEYLGKVIWVGWPHLSQAKVISVSNEKVRLHHIENQNNISGLPIYTNEANTGNLYKQWISERSTIIEHNKNRLGIELGDVNVIIHAVNLKGYKWVVQEGSRMCRQGEWCAVPCGHALQTVLRSVPAHRTPPAHAPATSDAYPPGSTVFLLTQGQYYGCMATVVSSESIRSGRIKVQVTERPEPIPMAQAAASPYRTANHAAAACGITPQMLSRITGTVFVVDGERNELPTENQNKVNVGLNLKFNKKNQEVAGYTRRCQVTNSWLYSARCIELVKSYAKQFPELFDSLVYSFGNDVFFEGDLWPGKVGQKKHHEVSAWLKSQPHSAAPRRECGSEVLEPDELKALDDNLQAQLAELRDQVKKVTLQVKWNLLYKPELNEGNVIPDVKADYKLYDRVVCVRECGAGGAGGAAGGVRRGARGTVAGVLRADSTNPVRLSDRLNAAPTYHVMFDEPFLGGMTDELFDEPRFYRMQPTHMLNISFGRKLRQASSVGYPNHPSIKDSYVFNKTPTLLRRDDGHHSAFASYSPPADKTSTPTDNRNSNKNGNPTPVTPEAPSQESATHLLKSLLKISKSDADNTPKTTNTPESWRSKNDNVQSPPQSQQPKIQQQNWRKEPTQYNNAKVQQQQVFTNEWVNSNFKSQAPVPPYPNFGQFPGPGPSQIPYPQFQNPNFQMHNQNYGMPNQRPQYNHMNQGNMYHQNRQIEQHFPKHLPPVTGNNASISLMPSRVQPQHPPMVCDTSMTANTNPAAPAHNVADKINNPFVPLQVQTRRIQNTSGPSRRDSEDSTTKSALPKPQPINATMTQNQDPTSRPMKKRKPRIAANLPFQID